MAGEQLFAGLQGLGLISSEDRHHRDALGQVSDHIEQSAHALGSPEGGLAGKLLQGYVTPPGAAVAVRARR